MYKIAHALSVVQNKVFILHNSWFVKCGYQIQYTTTCLFSSQIALNLKQLASSWLNNLRRQLKKTQLFSRRRTKIIDLTSWAFRLRITTQNYFFILNLSLKPSNNFKFITCSLLKATQTLSKLSSWNFTKHIIIIITNQTRLLAYRLL